MSAPQPWVPPERSSWSSEPVAARPPKEIPAWVVFLVLYVALLAMSLGCVATAAAMGDHRDGWMLFLQISLVLVGWWGLVICTSGGDGAALGTLVAIIDAAIVHYWLTGSIW